MVEILLATYNGEKYLAAQINSILSQSYKNWKLLIHDDGSHDKSLDILKSYVDRYPDKIELIEDGISTGSAKNNFNFLLSLSKAPYVAFCDQDDVWLENRLELGYTAILKAEAEFGASRPIVVCSDCCIVNHELHIVAESCWRHQRNGPHFAESSGTLAVRNYLTGCTMLINRSAINVSIPIPTQAVMHDWWIGLSVLRAEGEIIPIGTPTVLYRQHHKNVVGASKFDAAHYIARTVGFRRAIQDLVSVYKMAKHSGAVRNWLHFMIMKIIVFIRIVK